MKMQLKIGDSIVVEKRYWNGITNKKGWHVISGTVFYSTVYVNGRKNYYHISIDKNDKVKFRKTILFEKFLIPFKDELF